MRHFLLRVFKILLTLSIIGFLWGGWYLYNKGFSRSWRNRLSTEFQRHGVELSVRRLTLDPFRGLIAKDVRIFDGVGSSEVLAEVSHIGLDINYGNLMRGKTFLNALDLRDTSLSLRVDRNDKKAPKLEVTKLKARIMFPQQQVRITQAQFEVAGITCRISGNLLIPDGYKMKLPDNQNGDDNPVLRQLVEELGKTEFDPNHASIEVEFSGDVSHLEDILLEKVIFDFGKIQRPRFSLEALNADLTFHDRILTLNTLHVRDARGILEVSGFFNTITEQGKAQLRSTLALQPIVAELVGRDLMGEITFYSQPEVDAFVTIDTKADHKLRVLGGIAVEKFAIRSVVFQSFHADFSWDGESSLIRNIELLQRSGHLTGQLLRRPDDFRVMIDSTIDPATIAPLFGRNIIRFLGEWEFIDPPHIKLQGHGPGWDINTFQAEGTATLGKTIFRDQAVESAKTTLKIANGKTYYQDFKVRRKEGGATGTIIFDFRNQYVYFNNVHTEVIPVEAAIWVSRKLVQHVEPYRFSKPPKLAIDGKVKVRPKPQPPASNLPVRRAQPVTATPTAFPPPLDANLEIRVLPVEAMEYTFMDKELPFKQVTGTLLFEDKKLKIRNASALLFDGKVRMFADISLDQADQKYTANLSVKNMDFERITGLYFDYKDSAGRMSGNYEFSGKGRDAQTMQGSGDVHVVEGDVFAIPFLGPISTILNSIVPGMGVSKARDGTASFTIREGVIHTDDMVVAGQGFSLIGNGDLFFLDDQMDFDIRINARGLPGVLLFPVSKLFEYTSKDSLRDPKWTPKLLTLP